MLRVQFVMHMHMACVYMYHARESTVVTAVGEIFGGLDWRTQQCGWLMVPRACHQPLSGPNRRGTVLPEARGRTGYRVARRHGQQRVARRDGHR